MKTDKFAASESRASRNKTILPAKPELLAPAGGPAAWAAALEAGADAVYLGLKEFSARAYAANFSMADLARVIDLTHEQGAKVFVALNAILKEDELVKAARAVDDLTRLKPDALIVQDLGLLKIIRDYYPGFEIHASTLTTVHNLSGLEILAELGFDRAVLARELTLEEIEQLTENSPLGLEIFIHGAMCFSFSGLCLMSSYLGGKSSLRGACTQPCRRLYSHGRKKAHFFSPTDLSALELLESVRRLPLSALKIEGRMKGAEYVGRVVKAYRLLLDASAEDWEQALDEAESLVRASLGRERSTGFFLSSQPPAGLAPHLSATSGLFLGKVIDGGAGEGRLFLKNSLKTGDRLRVRFKNDDQGQAFTLKTIKRLDEEVTEAGPGEEVVMAVPCILAPGDLVFKVDSSEGEKTALASSLVRSLRSDRDAPVKKGRATPALKKVLAGLTPPAKAAPSLGRRPEVWYRVARAEVVTGLEKVKPDRIILPVSTANIKKIAGQRRRLGPLFSRIIWSLPPLAFNLSGLKADMARLFKMGINSYMISNLGHLTLVRPPAGGRVRKPTVYGDHRLNCLNTSSETRLVSLGLAGVTLCLETDENNLKSILARPAPGERLLYLFGRPPLFTSRFTPANLKDNLPVESSRRERFRLRYDRDCFLMVAEKPIFFAPLLKYKHLNGVRGFIVDLEFDPRPLATAREISEAVSRKRPLKNTSGFNWKRGLY